MAASHLHKTGAFELPDENTSAMLTSAITVAEISPRLVTGAFELPDEKRRFVKAGSDKTDIGQLNTTADLSRFEPL
eukprot:COSAG06_NODE_4015_length_4659_cov_4.272149_3_plen_76_part_00